MSVIFLKSELSYIYFIAPNLNIAHAIPVRFFYLQYFDVAGYVESGYTIL
jgi:hypothetical protein